MLNDKSMKRSPVASIQVLVAALNQNQSELLERLNLQTNAIISNQCEHYSYDKLSHNNCTVEWINTAERGVGLNRNNAWLRATADVVLIADDDMTFEDGYPEVVLEIFNNNPNADIIIFNIGERNPTRVRTLKPHYTKKCGYGAARFAIRREAVQMRGVCFNLFFGGGATYSHGEDNLFLSDCNAKGLRILVVPQMIATLNDNRDSTWNNGYTEKRIFDDGVLLAAQKIRLLALRKIIYAYRISQKNGMAIKKILGLLNQGIKHYSSI